MGTRRQDEQSPKRSTINMKRTRKISHHSRVPRHPAHTRQQRRANTRVWGNWWVQLAENVVMQGFTHRTDQIGLEQDNVKKVVMTSTIRTRSPNDDP